MIGRYLVLSLFAVALAACGRDGSAAALDTPIQLTPGQSAAFETEQLQVKFVDVASDSRCATDVSCLWAGELVLRLAIRSKGKETQHEVAERQSVTVDGYTVTVLEALPARGPEEHRIDPADYRATIKVTRAKSQ